jgi:26S proteasome regulatory subunit N9
VALVQACADGNVVQFQQLSQQYATQIQAQPALVHRAAAVQEKLSLLALVHTAFQKDAHERTLTLTELSTALHVPLDQVELLVMRALSVGLIQGSMDQVDGTVQVTWVMPRSLQTQQLEALATRYGEWANKVQTTNQQTLQTTPAFA